MVQSDEMGEEFSLLFLALKMRKLSNRQVV